MGRAHPFVTSLKQTSTGMSKEISSGVQSIMLEIMRTPGSFTISTSTTSKGTRYAGWTSCRATIQL